MSVSTGRIVGSSDFEQAADGIVPYGRSPIQQKIAEQKQPVALEQVFLYLEDSNYLIVVYESFYACVDVCILVVQFGR